MAKNQRIAPKSPSMHGGLGARLTDSPFEGRQSSMNNRLANSCIVIEITNTKHFQTAGLKLVRNTTRV